MIFDYRFAYLLPTSCELCVYLFRHRITGARGGVLHIRLNANSLPGLYNDVGCQHPAYIVYTQKVKKFRTNCIKV